MFLLMVIPKGNYRVCDRFALDDVVTVGLVLVLHEISTGKKKNNQADNQKRDP